MAARVTNDVVVYRATNLVNGKCYIGVTRRGVRVREKQHRATAARGQGYPIHAAIRAYRDYVVFTEEFNFGDDEELAFLYERELIAKERPAYNIAEGGGGRSGPWSEAGKASYRAKRAGKVPYRKGRPLSESHKAAISRANKGQGLGRKGRPLSEAHKQRLREANLGKQWALGRRMSDEAKAKIGDAHRGREYPERRGVPRSAETIAKMSAAQKGRPSIWKGTKRDYGPKVSAALKGKPQNRTEARVVAQTANLAKGTEARKRQVLCVTDGKVYASAVEAAEAYGLRREAVGQSIRRNQTTRVGLKFVWLENAR